MLVIPESQTYIQCPFGIIATSPQIAKFAGVASLVFLPTFAGYGRNKGTLDLALAKYAEAGRGPDGRHPWVPPGRGAARMGKKITVKKDSNLQHVIEFMVPFSSWIIMCM